MINYSAIRASMALALLLTLAINNPLKAQASSRKSSNVISQLISNQVKPTNMENQAAQTVKTFLTAVQKGDFPTATALIHPEIQWSQPGSNRFSGVKTSGTAVVQMVGGMIEASAQTLALADIKQLAINGNKVACLIRWKAVQPGGGVLDVDNIDVYKVENGKIVEATIYSEDLAQEDEFWGK